MHKSKFCPSRAEIDDTSSQKAGGELGSRIAPCSLFQRIDPLPSIAGDKLFMQIHENQTLLNDNLGILAKNLETRNAAVMQAARLRARHPNTAPIIILLKGAARTACVFCPNTVLAHVMMYGLYFVGRQGKRGHPTALAATLTFGIRIVSIDDKRGATCF